MLLNWKPWVWTSPNPSFSKPCPAVPVKAKGENPHNPNQHGEVRIIGEEGGGKQVAALHKQTVVNTPRHGQEWPQEGILPSFFFALHFPHLIKQSSLNYKSVSCEILAQSRAVRVETTGRWASAPCCHHTHRQGCLNHKLFSARSRLIGKQPWLSTVHCLLTLHQIKDEI